MGQEVRAVKITIEQKDLLKGLGGISSVVPTKTSLPILSTFLLESKGDGKITLTANDLDVSLTNTLACETEGGGSVAVPGKKFFEIIRSLPAEQVVIDTDGERISVKCRKSRFKMVGKNPEEFPKLPSQKSLAKFDIPTRTLDDMVSKTSYAVSTDLTRPSLCGVLWEVKGGNLAMVATDGHRLAKVGLGAVCKGVDDNEFIVSPKALNLLRSLSDEVDDVHLALAENHITFDLGDSVIYSRLLEGPFPDYNQVIPKKNNKDLTVSREELTSACKRVSILSSAITHQIKLVVTDDRLTMSVNTPDVGEAVEEVSCSYAHDNMEIGYNARYLLDILRTMESDDVTFKLDRNDNAGVVVPAANGGDIQHQCLLMPLRLSD
jgi:DNA polymerase-3 subunit beta